ncbi:MAG TPA: hypothetical protein VEF89_02595 [Solirubrobacteraceae bacterium]|nr:hypothetical protein [Solirubrobacteraceae bacterium]
MNHHLTAALAAPQIAQQRRDADHHRAALPLAAAKPGPRRWALVQVWDGAVLASFDHETSAREAMTGVDDDEVVALCVGT